MYVFFSAIFAAIAMMILKLKLPDNLKGWQAPKFAFGFIFVYVAAISFGTGAVGYNDSGSCTHVRTALGGEHAKCDLGWYFKGWGEATRYPHFITLANDTGSDAETAFLEKDYIVRMRDNWAARVSQTTRFKLPLDEDKFLHLARAYNSPQALSLALLRPAIDASLDVVASGLSMDDYYLNHKRNEFRKRFFRTLKHGFEVTAEDSAPDPRRGMGLFNAVEDSSTQQKFTPHHFSKFGIEVSLVELHHFRPDSDYTAQLKERKAASMRRTLMVEKRMSEEQELRLAKARQQITVANQSTDALVEQARITALAEANMKVAIMEQDTELQKAQSEIQIAELRLEKAKIESEASRIEAQAKAYGDKAISSATNDLDKRLSAYVETNRIWANVLAAKGKYAPANLPPSLANNPVTEANLMMDQLATGALDRTVNEVLVPEDSKSSE